MHLTHELSRISADILSYTSSPKFDPSGDYEPHRYPGRPRRKWDDYLKEYFQCHFIHRAEEHWTNIMRSEACMSLENDFCEFALRLNSNS